MSLCIVMVNKWKIGVSENVKTRGIVGEYQLGAIIEEILTKEQYDVNVATKKGSMNRVEYAIKLHKLPLKQELKVVQRIFMIST